MLDPRGRSAGRITSDLWHLRESQNKGCWSDLLLSGQLFGPDLQWCEMRRVDQDG